MDIPYAEIVFDKANPLGSSLRLAPYLFGDHNAGLSDAVDIKPLTQGTTNSVRNYRENTDEYADTLTSLSYSKSAAGSRIQTRTTPSWSRFTEKEQTSPSIGTVGFSRPATMPPLMLQHLTSHAQKS